MNCKICDNPTLEVYNGPLRRYFDFNNNKPNVKVFNCPNCSLSFLEKSLIDDNYYNENYYKNSKKLPNKTKRIHEAKMWHSKLSSLGLSVEQGSKILGFGAGTGDFESLFGKKIIVDTVEPDQNMRKNYLKFVNKSYSSIIDCSDGAYDYIFSFDVLEHIENLEQIMEQLYFKLKKKGIIVIGVPNLYDLYLDIFPIYQKQFYHHEHIWYFSAKFLVNLMKKYNIKAINCCGMHKYDFKNFIKWSELNDHLLNKKEVVDSEINFRWKKHLEKNMISSHIMIIGRKEIG